MRILFVGEYNRTHYNIKKGLESLGYNATVVSSTDGFKKVDVDIELKNPYEKWPLKKIRSLLVKLFNIDLLGLSLLKEFKKNKKQLSGYQIIQLVNDAPFLCNRTTQKKLLDLLLSWNPNSKLFLLSCGTDYISVKYAYDKKYRYNILTPYFEGKGLKLDFYHSLTYLTPTHKMLHDFILNRCVGIISNDIDYYEPLKNHPKHLGMIPHAINIDNLKYSEPIIDKKIVIFHGVNTHNYYKKGNDIFDEAIAIIQTKYKDNIEVIRTENLPYKEYIRCFNKAHILLDQVYAYDQGFNALEAMAKGKVVFTGAEQEWLDYYNLKPNTVAINALPNANAIANKLSWLIDNPNNIIEISKKGRFFVEQHHHYIDIAKSYLKIWR